MALTSRITLHGRGGDGDLLSSDTAGNDGPEDLFGSALGVIFPDDVTNQHGDPEHTLRWTSPHLRGPLNIALADPTQEGDRKLFSHYLWNSSLLLGELVEAGTLGVPLSSSADDGGGDRETGGLPLAAFDVTAKRTLELGAGTALPSLLAALLGAAEVVVSDYPAEPVLAALRANVAANARAELSPLSASPASPSIPAPTSVEPHAWGEVAAGLGARRAAAFDRVFVADCLWMPWQHANLARSIAHFLAAPAGQAWVVAGFHTGRAKVAAFFAPANLRGHGGLRVERIWERDCDGVERPWCPDRGVEDVTERKRWLVVAVLVRAGDGEVGAGVEMDGRIDGGAG
ncbi:nicotinamide N-methyltransferase [Xylariomycetidae sp. FL0641]|nr:nicotinamide N-methyltransferase [Xylariomycetidae sp. FL0641]